MSDIANDDLDSDLISDPLNTSNIKVDKTFVVDGAVPVAKGMNPEINTVSTGPLGENIPGELPDFEAKFKIIEENHIKILSFKDVEHQLLTGKSIGQETARYIDQVFTNFLSDSEGYEGIGMESFRLKSFTQEPSNINYAKTLAYVKLRIAKEEQEIVSVVGDVLNGYVSVTIDKLRDFVSVNLGPLVDSINKVVNDNLIGFRKLRDSKDLVVIVNGESTNLGTVDLLGTTIKELHSHITLNCAQYSPYIVKLMDSLISISEVLKKRSMLSFMLYLKADSSLTYSDVAVSNIDMLFYNDDRAITLLDLLDIFLDKDIANRLSDIYTSMLGDTDNQYGWNAGELKSILATFAKEGDGAKFVWLDTHKEDLKDSLEVLHNLDMLRVLMSGLVFELHTVAAIQ